MRRSASSRPMSRTLLGLNGCTECWQANRRANMMRGKLPMHLTPRYADHPLGAGMNMHMSGFDGLLVTAPGLVECLDEVELEAQQPSAIAPVHADVCLLQVTLATL